MTTKRFCAIALSLPLFLAACEVAPVASGSVNGEVSRLTALGYQVTGKSASGSTVVMRYSGPVTAAVRCGQPSGTQGTLRPRVIAANGVVQEFKLNSYLILSGAKARDGLYVVSKTTRSSARSAATSIETIAFEPGNRGTFPSGLSCRAT